MNPKKDTAVKQVAKDATNKKPAQVNAQANGAPQGAAAASNEFRIQSFMDLTGDALNFHKPGKIIAVSIDKNQTNSLFFR